jgi:CcdB protein
MSQFDIHTNPFRRSKEHRPFLVILQSDLILLDFDSVVVAPLQPASAGKFASRLNPAITFDDQAFVLIIQDPGSLDGACSVTTLHPAHCLFPASPHASFAISRSLNF